MPRKHAVDAGDLQADCARCFALCCVALHFEASADFAFDKPSGTPCRNLAPDLRCAIHADLRPRGFNGCVVYDCQGAGQKVSQVTLGGRDWRSDVESARLLPVVYPIVRQLHEVLAYLAEAREVPEAHALRGDLDELVVHVDELTRLPPDGLTHVDVAEQRRRAGALLDEVSALARRPSPPPRRNADLIGADLRSVDLRRADLRGAYLIAADLRGVDLRRADLRGADLRDADLRGADLTGCLFLTRAQLQAARGDRSTQLPAQHVRPAHWPSS